MYFFKEPTPKDSISIGFKPTQWIYLQRRIAKFVISFLGYNGQSRFWNEFTQLLDPHYIALVGDHKYWLKTGHGRLFWRARTVLTEEPYIIEWLQSMDESDVFYDIGANVGIYTLLGATKADHTYAFEPVFQNLSVLEENIVRNRLEDTVTIIPIALDRKQRVVKIRHRSLGASEANGNAAAAFLPSRCGCCAQVPGQGGVPARRSAPTVC